MIASYSKNLKIEHRQESDNMQGLSQDTTNTNLKIGHRQQSHNMQELSQDTIISNLKIKHRQESHNMQELSQDATNSPSSNVSNTTKNVSKWTRKKKITIFVLVLILVGISVSIPFIVLSIREKNSIKFYKKNIDQQIDIDVQIDEQEEGKILKYFKYSQNGLQRLLTEDSEKISLCENLIISNKSEEQESIESYFRCGDQKEWVKFSQKDYPFNDEVVKIDEENKISDLNTQKQERSQVDAHQIYSELQKQTTNNNPERTLFDIGTKEWTENLACGGVIKYIQIGLYQTVCYKCCKILWGQGRLTYTCCYNLFFAFQTYSSCVIPCKQTCGQINCNNCQCERESQCCPIGMDPYSNYCSCQINKQFKLIAQ